jgi:hypothetical protein
MTPFVLLKLKHLISTRPTNDDNDNDNENDDDIFIITYILYPNRFIDRQH